MSQYGLNALLRPASIAVIGASIHPHRAGYLMMRNLLDGGFTGPVLPVSPRHKAVCGVLAYPNIASLPLTPDLAILCTHARHTPTLLQQLGERGCRAVIVLSGHASDHEQLRQLAQRYRLRLLGPNSLGILAPWQGLNASFSPVSARPGKLAFVSQSTAVATTVLDWAAPRQIGFSHFIALGDGLDVDVDDLLDYLASDSKTSAILLYLEQLTDARRFLSAARAAARNKPILVVKSGRSAAARALLDAQGLDSAYDAAFARAGLLRVRDTHELFAAVETLHHNLKVRGERLAIISNGAAPAAMAVDELISRGGKLATFSTEERQSLHLPPVANPIPLNLGDAADAEHYLAALQMVLDSDQCDAILLLHAPSAISPATATAERITAFLHTHPKGKHKDILTCWSGEQVSLQARQHFAATGLPTYRTVESAVAAFMHRVEYKRNQKQLMETPISLAGLPIDTSAAQSLLSQACAQQQWQLDTCQVRAILQAYNLTVQPALPATDAAEAVILAEQLGYPVAVKLRSYDIPHKSDVQGVMLNLQTPLEVQQAADAILERTARTYPAAVLQGLQVQAMVQRQGTQELRIKVVTDPVFGPIILLGEGGSEWQMENDAVVALPPLNLTLARYLVISALKRGKIRNRTQLDIGALSRLLVQVSYLILDCPMVSTLDIHPLLASGSDMILLDVAMQIAAPQGDPQRRLAIRPYPKELEEIVHLKQGEPCMLRPILPEDEPLHRAFIANVTREDLYRRYFSEVGEFSHEDLAHMTQIDYDREMAFVAVRQLGHQQEIIGVARALADPDFQDAEFAVLVRSDLKGLGIGRLLMEKLIRYARDSGLQRLSGITMPANQGMIRLAQKLGFQTEMLLEDGIVNLQLPLTGSAP